MRVMGISRLIRLMDGATEPAVGNVRAFLAELGGADWISQDDVCETYPSAELDGRCVVVPLGEEQYVTLSIQYEVGIALIEHAGPKVKHEAQLRRTRVRA